MLTPREKSSLPEKKSPQRRIEPATLRQFMLVVQFIQTVTEGVPVVLASKRCTSLAQVQTDADMNQTRREEFPS